MTYTLYTTRQFEKDLRRCVKRGYPIEKLKKVIEILVSEGGYLLNTIRTDL